jgi:alkylation response protein AidB-like acyl-CoA dehydrogenase
VGDEDMSDELTREQMIAELEANRYRIQSKASTRILRTIDDALEYGGKYAALFTTIESAYEHLLEQRRIAELEAEVAESRAFIQELANWKDDGKPFAGNRFESIFSRFRDTARVLRVKWNPTKKEDK